MKPRRANEHHVTGPPGCGKTSFVASEVARRSQEVGPDRVLVCSLTKAAAREAAGRVHDQVRVGNIHSLVYRPLGSPAIVEEADLRAWNEKHRQWEISDEGASCAVFREYELLRARDTPRERWGQRVTSFAIAWEDYKRSISKVDFGDLIEGAIRHLPYAPGNPSVILADERQDLSALELRLLRRWALNADAFYLVGDPMQSIFTFRGACRDEDSAPPESSITLHYSHRIPRRVHARAVRLISRMCGEDYRFDPRDEEGSVSTCETIHRIGAPSGRSSMLIAASAYALAPVVRKLKDAGLPYHNPFSEKWNPLRKDGTAGRLLSLFGARVEGNLPRWTGPELARWLPMLRANCFAGSREKLLDCAYPTIAMLAQELTEEALEGLLSDFTSQRPDWLLRAVTSDFREKLKYPAAVLAKLGLERMSTEVAMPPRSRPWPIVGTIHSVKGGEADDVYLWPDLTRAFFEQSRKPGWDGANAIKRLFYVGMTRARERLFLGRPSTGMRAEI